MWGLEHLVLLHVQLGSLPMQTHTCYKPLNACWAELLSAAEQKTTMNESNVAVNGRRYSINFQNMKNLKCVLYEI